MGESLKALMGDAYHDGITVEEIETFVQGGKIVNLNSGKYVDKSKYDRVESELSSLKESTKDYDTLKSENETYKAEKANSELKSTLEKHGVNPDFFKYVKTDIDEKTLVLGQDEAKNKEAIEKYLKEHPQFAKQASDKKLEKKVVTTKVEPNGGKSEDMNAIINDNFRRALGKKTASD